MESIFTHFASDDLVSMAKQHLHLPKEYHPFHIVVTVEKFLGKIGEALQDILEGKTFCDHRTINLHIYGGMSL